MASSGDKIVPGGEEGVQVDFTESAIDAHFLLRGGRPNYENKMFSKAQVEALTVLCDTIFPSLDSEDDQLKSFYGTSASQTGIPQHLAGYMSQRLVHAALGLLRLSLWLLSTWYGTFILCGRLSLSCHFPFFQRFSQILQHRREEIMLSWSHSYWYLLRLLFKGVKFLCCLSFYTKVNEKNENPSWKTMGYYGPDPELSERSKEVPSPCKGPLHDKVIDLDKYNINIADVLLKAGCEVDQGASNLERLWNRKGKKQNQTTTVKCDVVVVGSGSGGGARKGGAQSNCCGKGKILCKEGVILTGRAIAGSDV
ncbi:hypothetical protein KI387_037570 [Taxus chinensis]|uniref:Uncharacterized protein n=1 Tax=Taxus chinensis TaxID=29808 RepID=A0AA38FUF8_TAXCH|nr:hypothetical protein KI387_037570 [Taxus chinensis]